MVYVSLLELAFFLSGCLVGIFCFPGLMARIELAFCFFLERLFISHFLLARVHDLLMKLAFLVSAAAVY